MNKTLTSEREILSACKEIIANDGVSALNMRDIAQKCGVSVGAVYNYFPSKSDLISAGIKSVWTEIMQGGAQKAANDSFTEAVRALFETIHRGTEKYPSFFDIHAVNFGTDDKSRGREVMNEYFVQIKLELLRVLRSDAKVKKDAFSIDFTQKVFVDFVFSNIIMLLMEKKRSCDFLTEIIRRTIY